MVSVAWLYDDMGEEQDYSPRGIYADMAVIVRLTVAPSEFQLGRILELQDGATIALETLVPVDGQRVPSFRLLGSTRQEFGTEIERHPAVDELEALTTTEDGILYALTWDASNDTLLTGIEEADARLLEGSGSSSEWSFEIRFPTHEAASRFQAHCTDNGLRIGIDGVYNPTVPEAGVWGLLTDPQREAMIAAIENGYYDIPRNISTADLGDQLGISDQAVTERLRRGVSTLAVNTMLAEPNS